MPGQPADVADVAEVDDGADVAPADPTARAAQLNSDQPIAVDLDRHIYGAPTAAITVVEFGDFECPYCGSAAPVLRKLVDSSGGRVRLVWRNFPLFTVHRHALTAALAAEASGDFFWKMHDQLFAHQNRLADADLDGYAAAVGAGGVTGSAAQPFRAAVESDYRSGVDAGVKATPTLFIDGRRYTGRVELAALRNALGLTR
ncbi:MAG: DsbA family protein [Actinomycetota bacterium]|nr:DsbA family protein [Actinomycetota bacterium]